MFIIVLIVWNVVNSYMYMYPVHFLWFPYLLIILQNLLRCHYFFFYKFGTEQKKLHFLPFGIFIDNLKFNLQGGSCRQNGSFVKGHAANHCLCYRMQTVLYPSTKMQSFSSQWIHFLFDATVDVTEIISETTTKQILAKLLCITCFIKIYTMFLLAFRI